MYDSNGRPEIIEFAGEKERVKKDGANNSHIVIGKFTQAKNELKKLVILNATETAEISNFANHSNESSHQWLDKNGWDERISYVMTTDGMIYPVTLHIAKTKDGRNILYDINIKIKEGTATDEIATSQLVEKLTGQAVRVTKPSKDSIPQNPEKSSGNTKNSLSAEGKRTAPIGNYNVYGEDVRLVGDDIALVIEDTARRGCDIVRSIRQNRAYGERTGCR